MNPRKQLLIVPFVFALLAIAPDRASAASITLAGTTNGSLATATGVSSFNPATNVFTLTLTNTSPFDARITGVGFDLITGDFTSNGSSGLNGFSAANVAGFTFGDGSLGNVPQFSATVLDFGHLTGGNFSGGSPNNGIAPGSSLVFSVTGPFTNLGLNDEAIASSIFVRFQSVGYDGEGSDVARPTTNVSPVPEPASLVLLGSGLLSLQAAIRRRRKAPSTP